MSLPKIARRHLLLHLCICLGFLCLPYIFSSEGMLMRWPDLVNNGHDRSYFVVYLLLLAYFYANYYCLIPRFYFRRKLLTYFGIAVAALVFFLWFSYFFDRPREDILAFNFDGPPPGLETLMGEAPVKPKQNYHTTLLFLFGFVVCLCVAISGRLVKTRNEKMQAELSWLKAQINPHFLFNTLNSIYSLALTKDDRTPESIIQLSDLMRYIMHNANRDSIPLEKEIHHISNYVALQRTRLGDTVQISYEVEGSASGKTISPLILTSFIENAFKHGVNPDENSEIEIRIIIGGDGLQLICANRKVQTVQIESGIGIRNTHERLKLLYPERHTIGIVESDERYSIALTLQL